jgi:hypothetical protein
MASATPLVVPDKSQEAILEFSRSCYNMMNQQWNIREQMRKIDLAYMREQDLTAAQVRAKVMNQLGDPTKFRNVTVPVIMPQVESAVTYQSSVFLTGNPIIGWVAPPGQEDAALQYQAITEENQIRGGWVQELMMFFRDGFKYNLSCLEVTWDRLITWPVETDMGFMQGKQGKPKEVIWQGNCVKRKDPYNTFFDTRVLPTEIYKKGEFAGFTELYSRIALKKFLAELPDGMVQNYRKAFESGLGSIGPNAPGIESYYVPQLNPEALVNADIRGGFDWMRWASVAESSETKIAYKNLYEVTTLYARILPIDFGLNVPGRSTVQIWKFIFINHSVLVYSERQTNAHANLPILIGQPNCDGLGYQTKSLASNAEPFQAIGSALVNSAMAARRRAISDRGIYDPSRISEAHINSDNPAAKIPLRPGAFGKPINEAYYPIPFRDDQSAVAFQELPQIMQMANMVNGQNQARQGQFVKGNKTLHEYSDVMSNANGRDQMVAMGYESQVFTPMKEILKSNILQYQASGEIYSASLQKPVAIDPIELRKALVTFKLTDGLTPTDKVISSDEFAVGLQAMSTSPALAAGYNIAPAFTYLMKTRNVDFSPFEKSQQQVAFEQASNQWMEIATVAVQKGQDVKQLPPQPKPADYGYVPGAPADKQGTPAQSTPTNLAQANNTTGVPQ